MKRFGVWASCALLLLASSGCSLIPWFTKKHQTCDISSYRVPPVADASRLKSGADRADGPVVQVQETDFDFGKVFEVGGLLMHDFKVKNTGKSVLRIRKVLPG